ncbi:MAG: hypothetical protein E7510_10140 [Ruminococcus sp.]|nr:hypothetical protein [Ruminococcus sp.]
MSFDKVWFIIKRNILKNKFNSILNIILYVIIFNMLLVSVGVLGFFENYSEASQRYNRNFRTMMVYENDESDEKDIVSLFSGYEYVEMVINQNEYCMHMSFVDDKGNYDIDLKACNEKNVPEVIYGRQINFDNNDEILLPEKMLLYNNYTEEYDIIEAKNLIGTSIKCSKENFDYNTIYDEVENKIVSGRKDIGQTIIDFEVVGVYDSALYFEESYVGYISEKMSKILHASDIKDKSGYTYETIWVLSDTVENYNKLKQIAEENSLDYMVVTDIYERVKLFCIVGYIIIVGIFIFHFIVSGVLFKIETKKDRFIHNVLNICGYRKKEICKIVSAKYFILQFLSFWISIPISIVLLNKINFIFYSSEHMGGLVVGITPLAIFVCLILFIGKIIWVYYKYYVMTGKYTISKISDKKRKK